MTVRHSTLALFALASLATAGAAEPPARPNIVLVFADDLGWRDVGYQSDGAFLTPNIDALAKEGMVFTDAYAGGGNCAPSRACLMSGLYTPRHGLYAVGRTDRGPKQMQRLVPVPNTDGLRPAFVTVAESLKAAGYATGHIGKWHLAGKDGAKPTDQGFDISYDSFGNGELEEGSEGNQKGPPGDPKGIYTLTRKACEFIEDNKERPFFCYLAHHAIHTPLQTRPETRETVRKRAQEAGVTADYMGCTYDFDDSLGMLLGKLKELDLEKNTLLVFTSDNGATNASSQEPLRGNKGGYYEGGIREPLIIRWPGVIAPGTRSTVPVINQDFYPTFLAAARATRPDGLDGESLMPLLTGSGPLQRSAIFWHFPGYLDRPVIRGRDPVFRTRPVTVMRSGDWKLHLYHEEWELDGGRERLATNRAVELYNLRQDIGERHDLALTETAKRDELLDQLLAWTKSSGATIPDAPNPSYAPAKASRKKRK
ncbi:sulfatase [Luteolibacter marinus]|uniref:sulfatase n=1 Tax=Luteolibacter marinus TaxID=2776705 RepID=UPI0018693735|nr:sulfatase [Luteolibacter marinus]